MSEKEPLKAPKEENDTFSRSNLVLTHVDGSAGFLQLTDDSLNSLIVPHQQ